jgi:hypothetical protein
LLFFEWGSGGHMDPVEKAGMGRGQYLIIIAVLCAALLVGGAAYAGWIKAKDAAGKLGNASAGAFPASIPQMGGGGQNGSQAQGGAPANASAGRQDAFALPEAGKEVTLDFLYLESCSHCQAMKPIVAALSSRLPSDRFEVRYWNYATRGSANASAIYAAYSRAGYFQGQVPTFVANGNDSRVGEMSEADFKAWICSKFFEPKPDGC